MADSKQSVRKIWYQSIAQRSDAKKAYCFLPAIAGANNVIEDVRFDAGSFGTKLEAMKEAALIWPTIPLDEGEYIRAKVSEADASARAEIKAIQEARKELLGKAKAKQQKIS